MQIHPNYLHGLDLMVGNVGFDRIDKVSDTGSCMEFVQLACTAVQDSKNRKKYYPMNDENTQFIKFNLVPKLLTV